MPTNAVSEHQLIGGEDMPLLDQEKAVWQHPAPPYQT